MNASNAQAHEKGLWTLGAVTAVAVLFNGAWLLGLEITVVTGAWLGVTLWRKDNARLRMAVAYAWLLWFYLGVKRVVPVLNSETLDDVLLGVDRTLLGQTPAVWCDAWTSSVATELMSAFYLGYLAYLHGALLYALLGPVDGITRLGRIVFMAYVPGLAGYLLVPAVGPASAFPDVFTHSLEGGPITALNNAVVANGSSVYDAFPSLHVLITLALLTHDFAFLRRRFWWMLLPSVGLTASTVYLRYHYAVDVLAAVLMWAALLHVWKTQGLLKKDSVS